MNFFYSLCAVIILGFIPVAGVFGLGWTLLFGVAIPSIAAFFFIAGVIYRVMKWASAPVPFHIPTVSGQQKSLAWIRPDSPYTTAGVIKRLVVDILLFRPLFWNERVEVKDARHLIYRRNLYLWLGGMAFHWSLLVVLVRHLRFFTEPVPTFVLVVQSLDALVQDVMPLLYITDAVILIALLYLVLRRIVSPQIHYISLFSDYFAVLLLLAVAATGVLMRLLFKVDLVKIKELVIQALAFQPPRPDGIGLLFYIHLFLVCTLAAYFPWSKLMHMGGVFLSPTRNLTNTSRMKRHINPWDYPVKVHSYEEWEDDFRGPMKEAGVPVEKE
jgi:nitrate reductase gamma subunit